MAILGRTVRVIMRGVAVALVVLLLVAAGAAMGVWWEGGQSAAARARGACADARARRLQAEAPIVSGGSQPVHDQLGLQKNVRAIAESGVQRFC